MQIRLPKPQDAFDLRPELNGEKFHCGDLVEIKIGNKWIKFRWELNDDFGWFLMNQEMAIVPLKVEARLFRKEK
ncbi:DUF5348 domain-containing protein [Neomoorella thermoacetica]|uniref:DUF5348 domain-containing protein n=1 Tax=Neomoorella thermoacetica TaxID=1525 RepID=UPI0008FB0BD1|nr:DUF5348 domain-containing protein [Moorella thermoacetica]APC09058.1 hypothetical protein MTJW_19080 [Moorella thermoacetica]OIQ54995.1 hypothetical protein MORE_07410 [Moorella thermoacetica]